MAPVVIPGVNVALLTGPLVLGYMFGFGLYGILIVQVYTYSESFPRDRAGIKFVVWSMFLLSVSAFCCKCDDTAHNCSIPSARRFLQFSPLFRHGISTDLGDTDTLVTIDRAWEPLPALNGVVAAIAQGFYTWRIYSLTKKMVVPLIISLVVATQVVVSFYYGIVVSVEGRGADKLFALTPEITLWLSATATADVLCTATLVWTFSRQKQRSTFERTGSIINKLIRYSVETGAVTSLGAIIEVTLWLTTHQYNIHFIFFLVIGKLYSNMLMATLNARAPMLRDHNMASTSSVPQSSFWGDATKSQVLTMNGRGGVHISRTTNVAADDPIVMHNFNGEGQDKGYLV
ncbi:hypothetical protein B0H16DRAFT_63056 [Mycena metata]|uniref:DUF6534 domain-containing protein n=1 Tax=Mycena metata TaxID=1033252 RepID=A0AAD7IDV7_9AGAR|nr:hypothetical protein B0H16DRAFT_63056 [Mycena metata]